MGLLKESVRRSRSSSQRRITSGKTPWIPIRRWIRLKAKTKVDRCPLWSETLVRTKWWRTQLWRIRPLLLDLNRASKESRVLKTVGWHQQLLPEIRKETVKLLRMLIMLFKRSSWNRILATWWFLSRPSRGSLLCSWMPQRSLWATNLIQRQIKKRRHPRKETPLRKCWRVTKLARNGYLLQEVKIISLAIQDYSRNILPLKERVAPSVKFTRWQAQGAKSLY